MSCQGDVDLKVTVLFSGGKDSCLATWYAIHQGWKITSLLVMIPPSADSYMFHYPAVKWAHLQGEAIGIPATSSAAPSGKSAELEDLQTSLSILKNQGVDGLVSGAVASGYQKRKIDAICETLGIISYAPLWNKDPELLLKETLDLGFETYVAGVSALGFDESWLGRRIDEKTISELKSIHRKTGIHLSGEGGEYETFVTDACFFGKRIELTRTSKRWTGSSGHLIIEDAKLSSKR